VDEVVSGLLLLRPHPRVIATQYVGYQCFEDLPNIVVAVQRSACVRGNLSSLSVAMIASLRWFWFGFGVKSSKRRDETMARQSEGRYKSSSC
jgi:hypothetical protein